jgi:hypothetical protein
MGKNMCGDLGGIYVDEGESQALKMKVGNFDSSSVLRIQQ